MAILRNRYVLWAIALVAAFFLGLLPYYVRARQLQAQLDQSALQNRRLELRDLAGLAYLHAAQKNYGLAASTSSELFNAVQQMAQQAPTPERKKMYEDVYAYRDTVTAKLAKGDPGVLGDLQDVYLKTRSATTP